MNNGERLGLARKFDTFIFDWDGTLTSVKLLRKLNEKFNPAWRHYRAKSKSEMGNKVDLSKIDANIKKRIRRKQFENTAFSFFVDLSLSMYRSKLHNDVVEVLELLKRRNKKIALFTNGVPWRVVRELTYLKVEDYFEVIVSGQELHTLKPNPLGLEVTLNALNAKKGRALYIGDMVDDIIMAKYINVHSCAIAAGFDEFNVLKAAKPDYIFKSMEEFKNAL